jgi:hypothetical protein
MIGSLTCRSLHLGRSPVVEVLSLRRQSGRLVFVRLASFPGLSHIKLLHDDIVGCAMSNNVSILHLFNWRTGATYSLEESPDEDVGGLFSVVLWLVNSLTILVRAVVWP